MFVKNLMVPKNELIMVTPNNTIKRTLELLGKTTFSSIPVVDGDKFYGAVTKEKLYSFFYEKGLDRQSFLTDFTVQNVIDTDVPIISPFELIEKAAHFLEIRNTTFVAVVGDDGKFKGIITHHAIFHEFTDLFGLNKGRRVSVIAYDIPGQISKLSRIVSENNGDIISFVVIDPESLTDVKEIAMRIRTDDFQLLTQKITEAGFKIQ